MFMQMSELSKDYCAEEFWIGEYFKFTSRQDTMAKKNIW